ncbi:MAG: class III poly(R)-hydroxyalkanoic acid synthase subunit PhaC [Gammaproteobacteria bacterium]|nr:class III poly(R)-hydroxyalkanoic acid synthase subunit PhaC [Gammaproteobacteria bacterium]
MNPFAITPEAAVREISEFNAKLAQGLNTIGRLGGIEVGTSPRDQVYAEDKLVLYRYRPRTESQNPVPVLIVYALVNRPYMADLEGGRSLIQSLLDQGLDLYLIDWGYPDDGDRYLSLDDYINGYIDRCVDAVRGQRGVDRINLLGICQGGTFALCYTALHQDKVSNLITTVTPVDFHTKRDLLSHLVRHVDVDQCVEAFGNLPGEVLNWTFLGLKPFQLLVQKYLDLVDILDDPDRAANFLRMEKWIFDSPDQAGEAFREFIGQFYQENRLVKGTLSIGGRPVDLETVTVPVLNIYARDDHLVPPDSSRALAGCIGSSDYQEVEFPGGHIGVYVSNRAREMLPPAIGRWLNERT